MLSEALIGFTVTARRRTYRLHVVEFVRVVEFARLHATYTLTAVLRTGRHGDGQKAEGRRDKSYL